MTASDSQTDDNRELKAALLILLALAVYYPALNGGWLFDDALIHANPVITSGSLWRLWFSADPIDYWPVTESMLWCEWRLFGGNTLWWHLVGIALHTANAILVWRLLAELKIPGAFLAGAIFAVHPVNVEAVAWIIQQKTTLCTLFFLASLRSYVRYQETGHGYGASLLLFTLAILSKTQAAMLPVVLLLLAWWRYGKVGRAAFVRTLPFFAVAAFFVAIQISFQSGRGSLGEVIRDDGFLARLAGAGWVFWFYLSKALLPIRLAFVYPRWEIDPAEPLAWAPLAAMLALFGVAWWFRGGWGRPVLGGLGFFLINLVPVLGFHNISYMYYSFVADHWQYTAIIGVIALVAGSLTRLAQRLEFTASKPALAAAAVLVLGLAALGFQQARLYRSPMLVWNDVLKKTPSAAWHANLQMGIEHTAAASAYRGLVVHFAKEGNVEQQRQAREQMKLALETALDYYQQSMQQRPDHWKAPFNAVVALAMLDRHQEAIDLHATIAEKQLRFPAEGHGYLAKSYGGLGKHAMAAENYELAVKHNPKGVQLWFELGKARNRMGDYESAAVAFEKVVSLGGGGAVDLLRERGESLVALRQWDRAVENFRALVEKQPDSADAHYYLGLALAQSGKVSQGLDEFDRALLADPKHDRARRALADFSLANNLRNTAIEHLRKLIQANPQEDELRRKLGIALLQDEKTDEAIAVFEELRTRQPEDPILRRGLIEAYLVKKDFDGAQVHLEWLAQFDPSDARNLERLAVLATQRGQLDAAQKWWSKLIEARPELFEARIRLAGLQLQTGQHAAAIEQYNQVLRQHPDNPSALLGKAEAAFQTQDFDTAAEHYRQLVTRDERQALGWLRLGAIALRRGDGVEAVKLYRRGVQAAPQSPAAANDLAWLLACHPQAEMRDGEEAVRLAEAANTATQGKQASVLDTLAAAYAEAGRFDDAIRTVDQAIALSADADPRLVELLKSRRELFVTKTPYRDSTLAAAAPTPSDPAPENDGEPDK